MATSNEASFTLYVKNVNDRIKPETLKKSLYLLFSAIGEVIEVHIRKQQKYRGQAWIVFKNQRDAARAKGSLDQTLFYGKQLQLSFSKNKSDIIAKADGTYSILAQQKIKALEKQLEDTIDSSTSTTKRKLTKLDDYDDIDNDIKRSNNAQLGLNITETPTNELIATNIPSAAQLDQVRAMFKDSSPISVVIIPTNDAGLLYTKLNIDSTKIIYRLTFTTIPAAENCYQKHNRFKIDDEHKLKMAYLIDEREQIKKNIDDEIKVETIPPNQTVSLESGGVTM